MSVGPLRLVNDIGEALQRRVAVFSLSEHLQRCFGDAPVCERLLVPLHGDEHGLRLVAACEDDGGTEETHLGDDLGHVRAGVGDAHLASDGFTHASRIHTGPMRKSVALYNRTQRGKILRPP